MLVTGGIRAGEAALASAELYDPSARDFSADRCDDERRSGHTATLLRNGRVLARRRLRRRGPSVHRRALRPGDRPLRADRLADRSPRRRHGDAPSRRPRARRRRLRRQPAASRAPTSIDPQTGPLLADRSDARGSCGPHGDAAPRRSRARHRRQLARIAFCARPRSTTRGRGRFSATGSLTIRRHKHAAALLRNGRVLVLGGSDERDWRSRYRTAEVFDPREGTVLARRACSRRRGSRCPMPSPSRRREPCSSPAARR